MRISATLTRAIQRALSPNAIPTLRTLGKSIVVNLTRGKVFVPNICMNKVLGNLADCDNTALVIPAVNNTPSAVKKTCDNIFAYCSSFHSLILIDTTKGYKYYGGQGIILDETFKPLIIFGKELDIFEDTFSPRTNRHITLNNTCIISPSVFEREDIISKGIVKKIIPYLSGMTRDLNIRIVISNEIDSFVHVTPSPASMDVDNDIHRILENHLDEVKR